MRQHSAHKLGENEMELGWSAPASAPPPALYGSVSASYPVWPIIDTEYIGVDKIELILSTCYGKKTHLLVPGASYYLIDAKQTYSHI